jgi:hypothetical protein
MSFWKADMVIAGDWLRLLRHGHELEYVAVQIFEINPAATVPIIELAVIEAPGGAAISEADLLDPLEDGIELGIANVKGVVVPLERGVVIEQERQAVVHPNWREMAAFLIERQAEDVSEEPGGGYFVTRRHDGVV